MFFHYSGPQPQSVKRVRRTVLKDVTPAVINEARQAWGKKQKEKVVVVVMKLKETGVEYEQQAAERLKQVDSARCWHLASIRAIDKPLRCH